MPNKQLQRDGEDIAKGLEGSRVTPKYARKVRRQTQGLRGRFKRLNAAEDTDPDKLAKLRTKLAPLRQARAAKPDLFPGAPKKRRHATGGVAAR